LSRTTGSLKPLAPMVKDRNKMKSFYIVIFFLLFFCSCDLYKYTVMHTYKEFTCGKYRFSYVEYSSLWHRYDAYRLQKKNIFGKYKDIKFESYKWEPDLYDKWANKIDSAGCLIYYYHGRNFKNYKPLYQIDICNDSILKLKTCHRHTSTGANSTLAQ
jgi:hypothetical protein